MPLSRFIGQYVVRDLRFQVSGVRCQEEGVLNSDMKLDVNITANRRISKDGVASLNLFL